MPQEIIGLSIESGSENGAQAVYHDADGIPSEEKTTPYLLSDGVSLQAPIPVYDAGGKVGLDSVGRPVDAWPVTMTFGPAGIAPFVIDPPIVMAQDDIYVGTHLPCSHGEWGGDPEPEFAIQWQTGSAANGPWLDIQGQTNSIYEPTESVEDGYLRIKVTATNTHSSTLAYSEPVGPVVPVPLPEFETFELTAGDSGDWLGYSNGDIVSPPFNPPVGSISNQPSRENDLYAIFQSTGSGSITAIFHGVMDHVGLRMQIGNTFGMAISVEYIGGNTEITFTHSVNFTDGGVYDITLYRS